MRIGQLGSLLRVDLAKEDNLYTPLLKNNDNSTFILLAMSVFDSSAAASEPGSITAENNRQDDITIRVLCTLN